MAKIKEGFKLCAVDNEYVVVAQGLQNIDFSKVITLNETGAYIWQQLEGKEFSPEDVAAVLLEAYEVDEKTAFQDAEAFFDAMRKASII